MTDDDVKYRLEELLLLAGAKVTGRSRANCPECSGNRTVSYEAARGVYCCHHEGCKFRGNAFTLARKLGLVRKLSPEAVRNLHRKRDEAQRAAEQALAQVRARRFQLYEADRSLSEIICHASDKLKVTLDDGIAWGALHFAYRNLDRVRAELLLLEGAAIPEILAFLNFNSGERSRRVETIVRGGGLLDRHGRFIELDAYMAGSVLS